MEVIVLGSGAPLAPDRATMGLLLRAPGCAPLLIDTCGGFEVIRRLGRVGALNETLQNIVITHRHGDHLGGAPALMMALPAPRFFGLEDTLEGLRRLMDICFPEVLSLLERESAFEVVAAGEGYEIGGFEVSFFEVPHRVPTLAVRIARGGKVLAFSADCLPGEALVACARGADLFLCDALCATGDLPDARQRAQRLMHPTAHEAGELARAAGAKALALVHLARFADPAAVLREAATVFPGVLTLPADGSRYLL